MVWPWPWVSANAPAASSAEITQWCPSAPRLPQPRRSPTQLQRQLPKANPLWVPQPLQVPEPLQQSQPPRCLVCQRCLSCPSCPACQGCQECQLRPSWACQVYQGCQPCQVWGLCRPCQAAGARCTGCTGRTRCSRPPGEGGGDAGHARHATDARRISQDVRDARDARHATNGTWHGNAGDAADDGRSSCEGWNAYYARHAWRCYAQDVRRFNLPTDVLSEEAQMYIIGEMSEFGRAGWAFLSSCSPKVLYSSAVVADCSWEGLGGRAPCLKCEGC